MKTTFLALALLLSLNVYSNRESGGMAAGQRQHMLKAVYLNFISPGNGIDLITFNKAQSLINFSKKAGLVKETALRGMGREGERVLCVEFSDESLSYALIAELAPRMIKDRRTSALIGDDCSNLSLAVEQDLTDYIVLNEPMGLYESVYRALDIKEVHLNPEIAGSAKFEKSIGGLSCTKSSLVIPNAKKKFDCFLDDKHNAEVIYRSLSTEGRIINLEGNRGHSITTEKRVGALNCKEHSNFVSLRLITYSCALIKPEISIE